jgi:hypothetical protein
VLPAGGTAQPGSLASVGAQRTWFLEPGVQTLGDPPRVEVEVGADGQVVLRALLDPVHVDGRPVVELLLADGNRIEARGATMVFLADAVDDDGGREGGEGG